VLLLIVCAFSYQNRRNQIDKFLDDPLNGSSPSNS
jgi:hypothetical protein